MFHFVDDNEAFLEVITALVRAKGYDCRTFNSPAKYLEHIESSGDQEPVALFTDVEMPEMSGFDMLRKVRQRYPDVRTAIMSGFTDKEIDDSCCLFLCKPVRPETLLKAFEAFMRCWEQGPDDLAIGCRESDDRGALKIDCWNCPMIVRHRESS